MVNKKEEKTRKIVNCRLVIGKIHISKWVKHEFENRLKELIFSGEEYIQDSGRGKDKFIWTFGDPLIENIDTEKVIFGRLGKIRRGYEEIIYLKGQKSFQRKLEDQTDGKESVRALSYSNFAIHPQSMKIIFEEKTPNISINQFIENFSKIYSFHFNDISEIKIDVIIETEKVFDKIKKFDKITEAVFKLIPSNPEDEPDFRRLDGLLKEGDTKEAILNFKNEDEGLKIENTIIGEGIAMSGAAYGNYKLTLVKNKEIEIVKSSDHIYRKYIKEIDEPFILIKTFWDILKKLSRK